METDMDVGRRPAMDGCGEPQPFTAPAQLNAVTGLP